MFEGKNSSGIVQKVPFIFPNQLIHKYVADLMKMMLIRHHDFENLETCKVAAQVGDADIINHYNYFHGIDS